MKKSRGWWQINIQLQGTPSFSEIEGLGTLLRQIGGSSIEEIYKYRRLRCLRTYLPQQKSKKTIRALMQRILKPWNINPRHFRIAIRHFHDQTWKDAWKKFARPLRFQNLTKKLIVLPSHLAPQYKNAGSAEVVLMDAGMAFGTGSHPTTYLCLKTLLALCARSSPRSLLDLGTGSGILAIAGEKLGIRRITALDCDPEATQVAQENLQKNHSACIAVHTGTLNNSYGVYEIILANLTLHPLVNLTPSLKKHLAINGTLVLSGILRQQIPEMRKALKQNGLRVQEKKIWRGWGCLTVKHKGIKKMPHK